MSSVANFARDGYFGPGIGDLLLRYGQEWKRGGAPEHLQELRGPKKMCFRTCTELALSYPDELVYAEGYAFADIPIRLPLAHAWLLHKDQVVDPTWSGGDGYFGIAFSAEDLQKYLLLSEQYGVLQSLWSSSKLQEVLMDDLAAV